MKNILTFQDSLGVVEVAPTMLRLPSEGVFVYHLASILWTCVAHDASIADIIPQSQDSERDASGNISSNRITFDDIGVANTMSHQFDSQVLLRVLSMKVRPYRTGV